MTVETKKAVVETVKSFLRYMWFGAVALVVTWLQAKLGDGTVDGSLTIVLTLVIKLLDTYVHNNKSIRPNGLAPGFLQR